MLFKNLAFSVLLMFFACNGQPPPDPDPPPICELTPEDCDSGVVDLDECKCVTVDPPPPPVCEIDPDDCESGQVDEIDCECVPVPGKNPPTSTYINMDRVEAIINGTSSQNPGMLHGIVGAGWRDPLNVATNCPNEVGYLHFESAAELQAFGITGQGLSSEGDTMVGRLRTVNKRCPSTHDDHDHPGWVDDDAYCGRSDVRKSRLTEFRARLDPHMSRATLARELAGRCRAALGDAGGNAFDSISGWCSSLRIANGATGFTVEDCPQ